MLKNADWPGSLRSRPVRRRSRLRRVADTFVKRALLPGIPASHAQRFVFPDMTRASWFPSCIEQAAGGTTVLAGANTYTGSTTVNGL